jgi:hypothetical protein
MIEEGLDGHYEPVRMELALKIGKAISFELNLC